MIDFTQPILDLDDQIIPLPNADGTLSDKPLRLSKICIDALLATFKDEESLSGDDKIERTMLAQKIKKSDSDGLELKTEERATLKKLVNKAWPQPLITARAWELIEANNAQLLKKAGVDQVIVDQP